MQTDIPIRISKRAKRMSIVVHPGGRWEVVVPHQARLSDTRIRHFVRTQQDWIDKQLERAQRQNPQKTLSHRGVPRPAIEKQTRLLIEESIIKFRRFQPFTVDEVRLRKYKSQWGNCTHKHRLSFHYKLSLLPRELAEYIIAHELCHTLHFNHSKAFWTLLETIYPRAKTCRKLLRDYTP